MTIIGLPAKKSKKEDSKKPTAFIKMHTSKKEEGMYVIHCSVCVCVFVV